MTGLDVLPPWHRSCRADVPIAPATIAGILDGDGSVDGDGRWSASGTDTRRAGCRSSGSRCATTTQSHSWSPARSLTTSSALGRPDAGVTDGQALVDLGAFGLNFPATRTDAAGTAVREEVGVARTQPIVIGYANVAVIGRLAEVVKNARFSVT